MNTTERLQIRGIARDPSGLLASGPPMLRQAKNVVLRDAGIAETRPAFDILANDSTPGLTIASLHEYGSAVVMVTYNGGTWTLRNSAGGVFTAATGAIQPPDYDACETKFAEARGNLYLTGALGELVMESNGGGGGTARFAGVDFAMATDVLTANWSGAIPESSYTWAYQFVLVRTDGNNYTRRSPPSGRYVISSNVRVVPQGSTRIYVSSNGVAAGDRVECYRSRTADALTPNPDVYLAWVYTLTAGDLVAGYFTPPYDTNEDDDLGADLYTNTTQGSALAAKYAPPRAQLLALYGSCMWYGRTVAKQRAGWTLRSVNLAGPVKGPTDSVGMYTLGSPTVTVHDSSQYDIGAYWTDNLLAGPASAGTFVPATTRILAAPTPTTLTLSANALATGHAMSGQMYLHARVGIVAPCPPSSVAGGTHTIGSPFVTGIASTTGLRAGMGWTNNAVAGPTVAGTLTAAETKILAVTGPNTITLDKNAVGSGNGGFAVDAFTVGGVTFYGWPGDATFGTVPATSPWNWPVRCIPYWSNSYGVGDSVDGQIQIKTFVSNFVEAVNYYQATHQSTFKIKAIATGDMNLDRDNDGDGTWPVPVFGHGVVLEEVGVGGSSFTFSTTRPEAFDPAPAYVSTNDDKPNRLYFSDPDEPESVPLLNYVDVGTQGQPILALVPLRNALLVFKADGLYRVSGSAPTQWTVDTIDVTLRLVRPESVDVMNNVAYAWCDRGFFAVTEEGGQSLSEGCIDVELRAAAAHVTYGGTHGAFVVPWRTRSMVLLGVPGDDGDVVSSTVYCYCATTQAWSEWPLSWRTGCSSKALDTIYDAEGSRGCEVRQGVNARGYDILYTLTTPTVAGTTVTVTIAHIGLWSPKVGDCIVQTIGSARVWRRITAFVSDGVTLTITIEAAFATTVGATYEAAEMAILELEWPPMPLPGVPVGGLWREIHLEMDLREMIDFKYDTLIPRYVAGGTSERNTVPVTLVSNKARVAQVQPIRFGVSRQIARAAMLAPYAATSDIYLIRFLGLAAVYEGTSEKVTR